MPALSTYTDEQLLQSLINGNGGAFEILYDRYWQLLYATAYKQLKNEAQAKDITQDIFVDLWQRRGQIEIGHLRGYLFAALRFQVSKAVSRDPGQFSAFLEPFEKMAVSGGADGKVMEKELSALFRAWLDCLPEKRRTIFLMRYSDNLSAKQIAEQLQIPLKTVHNQLGTATQSLADRLHFFLFLFG